MALVYFPLVIIEVPNCGLFLLVKLISIAYIDGKWSRDNLPAPALATRNNPLFVKMYTRVPGPIRLGLRAP